ncbi:MAG: carbohydrate ABC transporter permease [Fusobacteriaceae bacterium]
MNIKNKKEITGLFFMFPAFLIVGWFYLYPLLKTMIYSFFFTDSRGEIVQFAGLENFIELFTDKYFYESLFITFKFAGITVVLSILIALISAILCNEKMKGIPFFRTVFSSTMGVSVSAGSTIVLFMFHPSIGVINNFLMKLGILPINWLTSSKYALWAVIISSVWMNIGFGFLVLTAGLQNISQEIDESCQIDGTPYFSKLFKITIPLLGPNLFYLLITTTLKAFQSFGQVDILTGGGPSNSTNMLVYSLYKTAFVEFRYDYASVKGLVLLVIITAVMLIKFKLEKKVHYQ